MTRTTVLLSFIFFLALLRPDCVAQRSDTAQEKAERCILEYMYLSRLGPGYAREMNDETILQFRSLFSHDALLRWDLYRMPGDTLRFPLTARVYTDLAREIYGSVQPVLLYGEPRVRLSGGGQSATIYLRKLNIIMSPDDRTLYANRMNLQVTADLSSEMPLITGISRDERPPVIRSISGSVNYPGFSSALSAVMRNPELTGAKDVAFTRLDMTAGKALEAGMGLDLNLNRSDRQILIFTAGLVYSQFPVYSKVTGYSRTIPDTVGVKSENPIACTAFERSQGVYEKVLVRRIEVPLTFKTYVNRWFYVAPGIVPGYAFGSTRAVYMLSRTGGGLVTDLGSQQQYYLDPGHELDQSEYGYYHDRSFHFPKKRILSNMTLAFRLAVGFEKRFSDLTIAIEPNAGFGTNPLSHRTTDGTYRLDRVSDFRSFLQLVKMPAYDFSFGIRLVVSYLFTNE